MVFIGYAEGACVTCACYLITVRGSVFVFLSYRIPPSRQREFSKRGYGVSVDGPPS